MRNLRYHQIPVVVVILAAKPLYENSSFYRSIFKIVLKVLTALLLKLKISCPLRLTIIKFTQRSRNSFLAKHFDIAKMNYFLYGHVRYQLICRRTPKLSIKNYAQYKLNKMKLSIAIIYWRLPTEH